MMPKRLCMAVLLCACAWITPLRAQTVSGRVTSASDRSAVAHVFVIATDAAGIDRGGALTDSAGRYAFRVSAPGRYILRAERIGYESVTSAPFQLGEGTHTHDFALTARPLALEAVRAESGGRGCGVRRDGAAVHQLWSEIEKALRLAMFTDSRNALTYSTMLYSRDTDARMTTVQREQQTHRRGRSTAPFSTLAPAVLLENGFSRPDGDETILYGLDARVLLSREFLERYCFRLERSATPELIGLAFEPIRRRDVTDVQGVLWVDRTTAELRYLAYRYVNGPEHIAQFGAHSEVHFRRLETGLWVVERWWIRAPRLGVRPLATGAINSRAFHVIGYREEGGMLLAAEEGSRPAFHLIGGAALTGRVTGRTGAHAHGPATVFLSGTAYSAQTDEAGHFRIVGVPEGEYAASARDSLLDELRLPTQLQRVQLVAGQTVQRDIAWPTQVEMLRTLCPGEEEEVIAQNQALLYGDIVDEATGRAIAGAEVRIAWEGPDPRGVRVARWRTTTTGSDGRYYLCWVPHAQELALRVQSADVTRGLQVNVDSWVKRQDVR